MQRRKLRELNFDVSPEIAAIVVEKYLLPMFDAEQRIHMTKKDLKQLENNNRNQKVQFLKFVKIIKTFLPYISLNLVEMNILKTILENQRLLLASDSSSQ